MTDKLLLTKNMTFMMNRTTSIPIDTITRMVVEDRIDKMQGCYKFVIKFENWNDRSVVDVAFIVV